MTATFAEEYGVRGARQRVQLTWDEVSRRVCAAGGDPPSLYEVLHGRLRALYLDIEWRGAPDASVPRAVARTAEHALLAYTVFHSEEKEEIDIHARRLQHICLLLCWGGRTPLPVREPGNPQSNNHPQWTARE